jgi:Tfp pilus assembly protein PilF
MDGNKAVGTINEFWKAPNKVYSEIKLWGELNQEAFDGTVGWLKGKFGYANMSGQQLESKKRTSNCCFFANINDFKKIYPKIKLKGYQTAEDKETLVVEAFPPSGKPDLFYFSVNNNLLTRFDYYSESAYKKGVSVPTQVYFDEYFEVNGVMIPLVIRETTTGMATFIKFSPYQTKFNITIDDAKFSPPKNIDKEFADTLNNLEQSRIWIDKAAEEIAKKNYNAAINYYNKAIEASPNTPNGYNLRGIAFDLKGEYDKALTDFNQAISINLYNALLYYNRGNAYYKKSNFEAALEDFTKAIELSPTLPISYTSRCAVYFVKGNNELALKDCSKAIELDPTKASLFRDRAVVYERMGRSDLAKSDGEKADKLSKQ